jgi:hypothetical protein
MRRGTTYREELTRNFKATFNFEVESPLVDAALQVINGKKIMEEGQVETIPTCSAHRESATIHDLLECYNVTEEDQ